MSVDDLCHVSRLLIFFCDASAKLGPRPPRVEVFDRIKLDTHTTVGLLCISDQLVAQAATTQHTTNTRDEKLRPRPDSNPRSQQSNGSRSTPQTAWPQGSVFNKPVTFFFCRIVLYCTKLKTGSICLCRIQRQTSSKCLKYLQIQGRTDIPDVLFRSLCTQFEGGTK